MPTIRHLCAIAFGSYRRPGILGGNSSVMVEKPQGQNTLRRWAICRKVQKMGREPEYFPEELEGLDAMLSDTTRIRPTRLRLEC